MGKKVTTEIDVLHRGHLGERYKSLCDKFTGYCLDLELKEARKGILSFVVGLRFSALLIYEIRRILRNTALRADWGVIIDGRHCSPECDIVIHENDSEFAWNGQDDFEGPVMDFHFVRKDTVRLVVSCKSRVSEINQSMKDDVRNLSEFTNRVWLFAQCCEANKLNGLRKAAMKAGYEKFVHLYALPPDGVGCDYDESVWLDFAQSLKQLVLCTAQHKHKK